MLTKLKSLLDVEENLQELKKEIQNSSDKLKEQSNAVEEIGKQFSAFSTQSSSYINQLKTDIGSVSQIKDELQNELTDFKLLKTHLRKNIAEELTKEFREELIVHADRIKTDVKSYNDLKQNLTAIANELLVLKAEISKFNNISKSIKETDFELAKHAKNLQDSNNEKLELMRKIDTLQRLISFERRKKN